MLVERSREALVIPLDLDVTHVAFAALRKFDGKDVLMATVRDVGGIHAAFESSVQIADIVVRTLPSESCRSHPKLWAECIGGAVEQRQYLDLISTSGLRVATHAMNGEYRFTQGATVTAADEPVILHGRERHEAHAVGEGAGRRGCRRHR